MNFHFQTKEPLFLHLDHFLMQFRENSKPAFLGHEIHLAHFTLDTLMGLNGFKNKMWRAILHYACEILV